IRAAILTYAHESELTTNAVIEGALKHFLELDTSLGNEATTTAEDASLLAVPPPILLDISLYLEKLKHIDPHPLGIMLDMIEEIRENTVRALNSNLAAGNFAAYSNDVFCFSECQPSDLRETMYEPALCLVLQGAKRTMMDGRILNLGPGDSVVISHHVPVQAQITKASSLEPYIALIVKMNLGILRDLHREIAKIIKTSDTGYAVVSERADEALLETTYRLLETLSDPIESKLMGSAVYRELHLRLLQANHGGMLRQLATKDSAAEGISQAIKFIRENYEKALSVAVLAAEAAMSESSFYQKFREITGTTPNKYLKSLRLQEAHNFLSLQGMSVTQAAFAVGYQSVNHFSRDYSKAFGASPRTAKITAQ
ncbi:MAG: AraC family transcriptional regulator, partial [Cyanobacteria bacterium J06623_4]